MKRAAQKEKTRESIRLAALHLFESKGVDATTIQEITDMAGVAKGTFFYHFESKEMVMFELQQLWVAEELGKAISTPELPVIPTIQMLSEVLALRTHYSHGLMRSVMQSCMIDGAVRTRHQQMLTDCTGLIEKWITLGQERGEVTKQLNSLLLAEQVVQTYFGTLYMWTMSNGEIPLRDKVREAFQVLLFGFKP